MKKTLLEIAKGYKHKIGRSKNFKSDRENLELVIAWMRGEITSGQLKFAIGLGSASSIESYLAHTLKNGVMEEKIDFKID